MSGSSSDATTKPGRYCSCAFLLLAIVQLLDTPELIYYPDNHAHTDGEKTESPSSSNNLDSGEAPLPTKGEAKEEEPTVDSALAISYADHELTAAKMYSK